MESDETTRAPQSRRERPAKPALTRRGIVDAALDILSSEGLGKVTMRRIAAELDTGPSSLYVYVRNTGDLHARVLDALLGSTGGPTPDGGTWRDRLKGLVTGYMRVLFGYPEIARMMLSTQPSGPNYLSLVDRVLALLDEGGVPDREAAWAVDLLLLYATAVAAEQGTRKSSSRAADERSALAAEISAADAARYPNIARLGGELLSGPGLARYDWDLDVLIDGILTTPRTAGGKERE